MAAYTRQENFLAWLTGWSPQQKLGIMQGERDYAALKGPTGPLVYPAGHLYLYTWLYSLTGGGNIQAGQAVFAVIYWLNQVPQAQLSLEQAQTDLLWGFFILGHSPPGHTASGCSGRLCRPLLAYSGATGSAHSWPGSNEPACSENLRHRNAPSRHPWEMERLARLTQIWHHGFSSDDPSTWRLRWRSFPARQAWLTSAT